MNLGIQKEQSKRNRLDRNFLKLFSAKHNIVEEVDTNSEDKELLKTIMEARNEWLETVANFEHAFDEKLIDYYIYKMKACEERYTHFIMKAKEKGLKGLISQDLATICQNGEFSNNI